MHPSTLRISRIPAFQDNYLWLLDNGEQAMVVDPGDAEPVLTKLDELALQLSGIIITHHHPDHIGGVDALLKHSEVPVTGPKSENIPQVTNIVSDQSQVDMLGHNASVMTVPGHTLDHVAYFLAQPDGEAPALFCGDTLFAGGCGRLFEGTPGQMRASLAKLKQLPGNTRIYCAHEYTQANLAFAIAVEPDNNQLASRVEQVRELRSNNDATVPSTLAEEIATNPFLRYDQPALIAVAKQRLEKDDVNQDEVFGSIRQWKDNF